MSFFTARAQELITLHKLQSSKTEFFEVVEHYVPFKRLAASIMNNSADANFQNSSAFFENGSQLSTTIRFYCRYQPDLVVDNKNKKLYMIQHNDNDYYISSITHIGRRATILDASSVV